MGGPKNFIWGYMVSDPITIYHFALCKAQVKTHPEDRHPADLPTVPPMALSVLWLHTNGFVDIPVYTYTYIYIYICYIYMIDLICAFCASRNAISSCLNP